MAFIGFGQQGLARFAGPGHWNDPDMLEVGNGHMSPEEYKTHMSLWCLLAAPLISGNDLAGMSQETLAMLTNPEVVAVDQDPAGKQGYRVWQEGPLQVWMKPLADGSKAVGLFNEGESPMPVSVRFKDIGLSGKVSIHDLWERKDIGAFSGSYTTEVPRHGVVMLKVQPGS